MPGEQLRSSIQAGGRFTGGVPGGTQRPSCRRLGSPTHTRVWSRATFLVARSCREGVGQDACWRRGGGDVNRHTPCVWRQLGATAEEELQKVLRQ